jgi:hypothetical protein
MKPVRSLPILLLLLSLVPVAAHAQAWSGIISPSRAIDWTGAGIPGGIPSASWTQCGSTIAAYSGSTAAINSQISGCAANTYVQLAAGTFTLSGGIVLKNQTAIRGMGADQTLLVFTSNGSCNGLNTQFSLCGSGSYQGGNNTEQNKASWTAGFSQGATSITLSNSLNIVAGKTAIILDQQDEPKDTGNIWINAQGASGNDGSGSARTDGTCSTSVSPFVGFCSQQQQVLVTACSPSCNNSGSTVLTISPGLYMPNWNAPSVTGSTGAFWANTFGYQMGVENLSADLSKTNAGTNTIIIMNSYECWVSGVRSMVPGTQTHVWLWSSAKNIVRDNYFYGSASHQTQSYGVSLYAGASDNLIENNIFQQVTDSTPNNNGGGAGNVGSYNFAIMDIFYNGGNGWFQPSDYEHAGGQSFWLREGNDGLGQIADNVHGTHHFTTDFRNRYPGWQVAGCQNNSSAQTNQPCVANTTAMNFFAASRYFNIIGNVLGQTGYHTVYTSLAPTSNQNTSVFYLGGNPGGGSGSPGTFCANPACSSTTTSSDPLTQTSIMRWGNWDSVNAAVRFVDSEVPSSFGDTTGSPSVYANQVPASTTLPPSFLYSSKPSWFGSVPWPATGPDVTGGNMGICSGGTFDKSYAISSTQCAGGGTLVTAFGGHANANPAMTCYLNTMGGPPDGTGGPLSFNAATCYGNESSSPSPPKQKPAPPTALNTTVVTQP